MLKPSQIASNRIRATTILCTPDLIKPITPRLGRILGPLGLFPSERRGTVTDDIAGYIKKLAGTSEWRADKAGNIRAPIGMVRSPLYPTMCRYLQCSFCSSTSPPRMS